MAKSYEIMSGDTTVAIYENNALSVLDDSLVPMHLKRTGNLVSWIEQRAIDGSRANARMLKKAQSMPKNSPDFDTALKYNAATVTDNFWVRPKGNNLSWEDIRFKDDLYFRMAVASDDSAFEHKPSRTPELTNIGSREKGWRLESGKWWLYKKDETPEVELATYHIGKSIGYDMAHYEMKGRLIRSLDFTGGSVNLQHFDSIMGDNDDYSASFRTVKDIAPGEEKRYLDIICLDTIMNNPDRHTKNYGFLTSQEDGHIIKLAPNYDNDMALYGSQESWFTYSTNSHNMNEFISFCEKEKIKYEVPKLDRNIVSKACSSLENGDELTEYIMERNRIIRAEIEPPNITQYP